MRRGPPVRRKPSKLRDGEEAVRLFEQQQLEEVERKVRAGRSDKEGAAELHMDEVKFRRLREALALPFRGGAGRE
jgi:hypothetical protein